MASWMIHLRISDGLLRLFRDKIDITEFVVGNIAPDSGVPNEDWSRFSPDYTVSHFKRRTEDGKNEIDIDCFFKEHLTAEKTKCYDRKALSFFLGYYSHLLTDRLWVEKIYIPCCEKHADECSADKTAFTWKVKEDWYDLDFKYLRDNPNFCAFELYRGAVGFSNDFMDIFSRDAFDNRREYIVSFYNEKRDGLDRVYPFLSEKEANEFVASSVEFIKKEIEKFIF